MRASRRDSSRLWLDPQAPPKTNPRASPSRHIQFLEAYSQGQLTYGTGGPPNAQLLYALEDLREDFSDLEIVGLEKVEAEIQEGRYHTGLASVVRLVARC